MRANIFFLIQLEGNENELFFFKYEIIVPNIHWIQKNDSIKGFKKKQGIFFLFNKLYDVSLQESKIKFN